MNTGTATSSNNLSQLAQKLLADRFAGSVCPLWFKTNLTVDEQTFRRGKPRPYLEVACELMRAMQGDMIVEVGSMRGPMKHTLKEFNPYCCNDGHSTMFWASLGCQVHSVDIDPECSKIAAAACAAYPNVHIHNADGVAFLGAFSSPIDLLYLDAWDVVQGQPYAEAHLAAYEAVRAKLKPTSLILIDDTDVLFGGKGRLVLPVAIRDGYELLIMGRQTMLLRAQ